MWIVLVVAGLLGAAVTAIRLSRPAYLAKRQIDRRARRLAERIDLHDGTKNY